jgi:hypothetical protein
MTLDKIARLRVQGLSRRILQCTAGVLFFSVELFGQCNPKPTVYSLLEVMPAAIVAGSPNTQVTLRLQYIAAGLVGLDPLAFAVNWQGTVNETISVDGIGGQIGNVFFLTFTAKSQSINSAQQVTLSVIGTFCGEAVPGVSNTSSLSIVQPMPISISSLDPPRAPAGSPPFNITISGSGFTSDSRVRWNNQQRDTSFQSSSRLNATILAQDVARTGTARIDVVNGVTGVQSNALTIEISNPQPFITGINPPSTTAGTSGFTLTIDGSGFNADSRVRWNGTERATTLVSFNRLTAGILAVDVAVPVAAQITVMNPTPGGGQSNSFSINVGGGGTPDPIPSLFVPVIVSSTGLNNSFFTSELTLTNRSAQNASLTYLYTDRSGQGSGSGTDTILAGRQRVVPDAISYLRSVGIPIPSSGNRVGTLLVQISGITNPSDIAVTVRTTNAVAGGSAGLAYAGIPSSSALTGPVYLCGLLQNRVDRNNVAVQHAGSSTSGNIVLRVSVFSGDPGTPGVRGTQDITLSPGGFEQNEVLSSLGLSAGYVRVERVSGTAPFYAYGVINDQANSDGSFIPPLPESALIGRTSVTLPVIVEGSGFSSELVVTNFSGIPKNLRFSFVADAIQAPNTTATDSLLLQPGQQRIIPEFVQYLRNRGITGIGPAGPTFAGALFTTVDSGDLSGVFVGARTSIAGGGGRFGLFYTGVLAGTASEAPVWLNGLQQNANNRTNLALINTGDTNADTDVFAIEIFDGNTGVKVATAPAITLPARKWTQIGAILLANAPGVTQGYARVTRLTGANPFIAYGVINDGGQVGQRTGDGAFLASSP